MITDQKKRLESEVTAPASPGLRYLNYDLAHTVPDADLVVADCHYHRGLLLAHLYEERVPEAVRSNTSTEAAIKAIELCLIEGRTDVTCNHWDIDGFLAVWALVNPRQALEHKQVLIAAAMLGDFREFDPDTELGHRALKLCTLLNAFEAQEFCLPFGDLEDATIEYEVAAQKFEYFLARFSQALDNIDAYESLWLPEYSGVVSDIGAIRSGLVEITEYHTLGLSVVRTPHPLHYYGVCSSIRGGAMLTLLPDRQYAEFEYRYETRVGRLDKKTAPRRDLTALAERLTELETEPGIRWTFDNILLGGPMLRPESAAAPLSREECYQSMEYRLNRHPELRSGNPSERIEALVVEELDKLY